ncbi:beta-ketoacyl-[acyl-carrier-protein] synthase II [Micromonospora rosaria]|uniref:3-oxoacyl-[acyl-carrier-protein] synthase 2 n=1 Tax=Micromonospora rosaria TaxID=47874 RepID=A0A136Q081_9ACTN|nr:beta-ketoacyl-[acyl-carrier-protein] synthase family protein [Micromonospora rosaria]KXK63974.1 beta-ketoacyl-[acyl-carrier-protein] synthase II [Micromonospora rosaria]
MPEQGPRRVVVTGCGVVSPIGSTTARFWAGLLAGRSGIGPLRRIDAAELPVRIGGEIHDFDPAPYMPRTLSRRIDAYAQYAIAAAAQAVAQAGLPADGGLGPRAGAFVGTAVGPTQLCVDGALASQRRGHRAVSPHFFAVSGQDHAVNEIALRYRIQGPTMSVATGCATGTTCVGEAMRLIRAGVVDVMLAGGADAPLTVLDVGAAAMAGALSRRNDDPQRASRPFDTGRDGFVMSAGAAVVVLEEAGHARDRGATILAELTGYGATTDGHHLTAPQPEGLGSGRAMTAALADAGIGPADVDHVNAHGTGTRLNDTVEVRAIRRVFGDHATRVPITANKSMTGHMLGAAGAAELVATVHTVRTGRIPPTINCDEPEDPELDLVRDRPRERPVRRAMTNSFAFGGHNAVLVVQRWP